MGGENFPSPHPACMQHCPRSSWSPLNSRKKIHYCKSYRYRCITAATPKFCARRRVEGLKPKIHYSLVKGRPYPPCVVSTEWGAGGGGGLMPNCSQKSIASLNIETYSVVNRNKGQIDPATVGENRLPVAERRSRNLPDRDGRRRRAVGSGRVSQVPTVGRRLVSAVGRCVGRSRQRSAASLSLPQRRTVEDDPQAG